MISRDETQNSDGFPTPLRAAPRLLLIEDDEPLTRVLTDLLTSHGFHVEACNDGAKSLHRSVQEPFDLIVVDLVLPNRNGFDVCRVVRKHKIVTPILILTARHELKYKVKGLECGADDYVTKPFEPQELLARLRALLRRSREASLAPRCYRSSSLHVDFLESRIIREGQTIALSERETRILRHLIHRRGTIVSRTELLTEIWGYSSAALTRTVDTHIAILRQKVEPDVRHPRFILTVHGLGYRFNG